MSTPRFLDLPSCARVGTIATSRGEFAAHIAGPAEPAEVPADGTALLVPGFTGSKEDFIGLLEPLVQRGRRVVAIDPRGQYETPGPADETAYTVDELAADLIAVAAALIAPNGGRVHLVGHSLGGVAARHAAGMNPELVGSLTLLCSGPGALSGPPARRIELQLGALEQFDLATVARLREEHGEGNGHPPRIAAFLRDRFVANSKAALLAQSRYLLRAPDRLDEVAILLGAAGVPVLVAHGATDDAWPIDEQRMMADRLGAAYRVIPGTGHSPAVDDPTATADVLVDFWKRAELLTT